MAKKYPEPWKRGEFYYFTTQEHGKRRNVSTGCPLKEDARAKVRQYVDARAAGSADAFRAYSSPYFTWESCPHIARLLDEGKQIGRTHARQSRALLDKWILTDPIFPDLRMNKITRGDVLDLRRRLRERIPGMNTLNKSIIAAKTILAEAAYRGDIPADPGSRVGAIKYEGRERGAFTAAEVRGILAARPGDMGKSPLADAAVAVLFCSGCRVGELRALTWEAVNPATGRTAIRQAFQDQRRLGPVKWNKPREIVLARLALERLRAWKAKSLHTAPGDYIFTIDGPALGITAIGNMFDRVLKAAEEDKELDFKPGDRWLTPHAARTTLNTLLLANGVSPLLVQTFLGWSSSEARILTRVQRMYTRLELLRLEDAAAMVEKLYGGKKQGQKKRAEIA